MMPFNLEINTLHIKGTACLTMLEKWLFSPLLWSKRKIFPDNSFDCISKSCLTCNKSSLFRLRNTIQSEYAELKQKLDEFSMDVEENKKNPISKYDAAITKQSYFNDTLAKQVSLFEATIM